MNRNTHCVTRSNKAQPYANDAERHVWQNAYFAACRNKMSHEAAKRVASEAVAQQRS